jgi:peptide/nickel transport system substrate-binding protein
MRERRIRQAFLAALDAEAVMRGVYGPRQFWQMNPGIMPRGHPLWNDAGKELYNQKNPERARRLLAEAGYRGEPIRLLTTSEYIAHITSAQIAKPQLEKAGFVVDLQVFDWATVVTRRARPELWDVSITRFAFVPDPVQLLSLLPEWPGWYDNRDMQAHTKLMRRHTDPKVRKEIWKRAQRLFYEDAATVKLGDWTVMHLMREEVRGMVGGVTLYFWNVWQDRR